MKPSFALTFELDIIALLYRYRGNRWRVAGTAPGNADNLRNELESLRRIAIHLEPLRFSVKLYAERSQVLFASLEINPDDGSIANDDEVSAIVARNFSYDPNQHLFDWRATEKLVQFAMISRDYLAEMEEFATAPMFNPVSFAVLCDSNEFDGEPFFGMTFGAVKILGNGVQG